MEIEAKKQDELNRLKDKVKKLSEERDDHETLKAVIVQQESQVKALETEIETVKARLQSQCEKLKKCGESLNVCEVIKQ